MKITVTDCGGTYRDVADAARTTIHLEEGDKEVKESYMYRMYKSEHSPIRLREFKIVIDDCPYWVAMHFVRHHVGMTPFVSTQRTDRTGTDRTKLPQDAPVRLQMNANAQAMINMSRKRLCRCASMETRAIWRGVLEELKKIDTPLYMCCVPECVYRGHCPEMWGCFFDKTETYKVIRKSYQEGWKE